MTAAASADGLRLILHPGHPKCGSSTIQFALYANAKTLREQGYILPNRDFALPWESGWDRRLGNPLEVFRTIQTREDVRDFEPRLRAAADGMRREGAHTFILSAENLGNGEGVEKRRALHELLARLFDEVRVVFYIRRQDDWMVSAWQQWGHKQGSSLDQSVDWYLDRHHPDFLRITEAFTGIYGEEAFEVVPLFKPALAEGGLVGDFAKRAGLGPLPVPEEDSVRNASLSTSLCDVISRVPGLYEGVRGYALRDLFATLDSAEDLVFTRDKRLMTPSLRRRIMAAFEEDNRALHARFFPDLDFEGLYGVPSEDRSPMDEIRDEVDGLKDVVAMQMEMIVRLARERDEAASRAGWLRRLLGR